MGIIRAIKDKIRNGWVLYYAFDVLDVDQLQQRRCQGMTGLANLLAYQSSVPLAKLETPLQQPLWTDDGHWKLNQNIAQPLTDQLQLHLGRRNHAKLGPKPWRDP